MKRVILIHKEPDRECFEVLKRSNIEERILKKFSIDENTLLQKLPMKKVDKFLEILKIDRQARDFMLRLNRLGALFIEIEEEIIYNN